MVSKKKINIYTCVFTIVSCHCHKEERQVPQAMRNSLLTQGLRVILVVVIYAFSTGASLAQSRRVADLTALIERHADWDPGDFILNKLETNRIVVVGDAEHGDPLYSRVLVNSLNEWITRWAQTGPQTDAGRLPSKVFLVLEMDSVQADGLREYFKTGDPIHTIQPFSFIGNQFTTGVLKFFDDLRLIRHRVDSLNERRPSKDRIFFDVVGPEEIIDPASWTPAKRDSLFVHVRDEYSSSRIEELLDESPDAKALVYYGQMHLYTERMEKSKGKPESMGYYVAHYLKEHFGSNGGVYTVEQIDADAIPTRLDKAISRIGKTFATDGSVFSGAAVDPNAYIPWLDGAIFYFTPPRDARHLSMLYSEKLVDYILNNIDSFRDVSEEYNRWVVGSWLNYLSNVAAVPFHGINYGDSTAVDSAITAWKKWRRSTKLDVVGEIASLDYFKKCIDLIRNAGIPESMEYEQRLASLVGFRVWFPMGTSPQVQADSMWSHIQRYRNSVITENLVDLLWVASKLEKEKAMFVLAKETGMSFKTAEEWTSWWETRQAK